jgi:hypothetical protein
MDAELLPHIIRLRNALKTYAIEVAKSEHTREDSKQQFSRSIQPDLYTIITILFPAEKAAYSSNGTVPLEVHND